MKYDPIESVDLGQDEDWTNAESADVRYFFKEVEFLVEAGGSQKFTRYVEGTAKDKNTHPWDAKWKRKGVPGIPMSALVEMVVLAAKHDAISVAQLARVNVALGELLGRHAAAPSDA